MIGSLVVGLTKEAADAIDPATLPKAESESEALNVAGSLVLATTVQEAQALPAAAAAAAAPERPPTEALSIRDALERLAANPATGYDLLSLELARPDGPRKTVLRALLASAETQDVEDSAHIQKIVETLSTL